MLTRNKILLQWIFSNLIQISFGINTNEVTVGELGEVIGTVEQSEWNNRTIFSFRSIPYAEPPIDDLRFRPPVKITSWNNETLNATSYRPSCVQSTHAYSEDCLTLNVFVPEITNSDNQTELLPVLIFIHGGTFRAGTASEWYPDRLLDSGEIVLVVPQYRLGFLGLFSLETDDVPGNVQFLDQIMAMKWVQDNIQYFGGDKNRVTLSGHSSGAATVHYHMLSKLTEGLFQRVILQSGSGLRTYGIDKTPLESGLILSDYCGCKNITEPIEIAACMRAINVDDLLNCTDGYLDETVNDGLARARSHMAIVQTAGDEKFLTSTPNDLLKSGDYLKLPMMAGVTKNDGSSHFSDAYNNIIESDGLINDTEYARQNLTSYVLKYLGIEDITTGVLHTMIKTYFPNIDEYENIIEMAPGFIDICSLISYKSGSYEVLRANRIHEDTYAYTYNYEVYNPYADSPKYPFDRGVEHGHDTQLLFPREVYHREHDIDIAKVLVKLWTSFIIDGVPKADGITWPAMSTSVGPYLVIDTETSLNDNFLDEFVTDSENNSSSIKIPYNLIIVLVINVIFVTYVNEHFY